MFVNYLDWEYVRIIIYWFLIRFFFGEDGDGRFVMFVGWFFKIDNKEELG